MTTNDTASSQATAHAPETTEIDLSIVFSTLWRGKFWLIFTFAIGVCIGIWYAFFVATPMYTSTATVALDSREQQVMDIESVVTGLSGDRATINTEVEVIRSRSLARFVVLDLDLVNDPEFNSLLRDDPLFSISGAVDFIRERVLGQPAEEIVLTDEEVLEKVIDTFLSKVRVTNLRDSYVFRITATTENPRQSAQIANRLAEEYIQDQIRVKFERTEDATIWLSERVTDLQIALEEAEDALKEFSADTDLISPEGFIALNRQLKELRDRETDLKEAEANLQSELVQLRALREGDDFETFAEISEDRTLALILRDQGTAAPTLAPRADQIIATREAELARTANQIASISESVAGVEDRIARQSEELVEVQQLQREAEASRLIYEAFLARLKETSIQQGIQQADSRVLSPAVAATAPSSPRKGIALALSGILGLLAGGALLVIRELSQNTFRLGEELERSTGYAVLGEIPLIPTRKRSNVLKYLAEKPNSAAAEAVRSLRTSLLLANLDKKPQVILSTSSVPGEGKTTQSLALAQNFSGLGEKVLLVEGDIRRRVFREYFDVSQKEGFISVLSGQTKLEDAVVKDDLLGTDLLFGEKSNVNAADLYSSERFADFIDDLRKKYDRIIIDAPPVLAVSDARIIAKSVDAIIFSVKWDSTTRRQVQEGVRSFEIAKLKISGLVLSQIDGKALKRYGYGDRGYGGYSGYYDN